MRTPSFAPLVRETGPFRLEGLAEEPEEEVERPSAREAEGDLARESPFFAEAPSTRTPRHAVRRAQERLNFVFRKARLAENGLLDAPTVAALKRFQAVSGLRESGAVDDATLQALSDAALSVLIRVVGARARRSLANREIEEPEDTEESDREEVEDEEDERDEEADSESDEGEEPEESDEAGFDAEDEGDDEAEADEPESEDDESPFGEEASPFSDEEADFAGLSSSELKAVRITSKFETDHEGGFGGLTANFDGQGVSFGLMNFAMKAGSLPTLLAEMIAKHPEGWAAAFGPDAERFKEIVLATKPDPAHPGRRVRDVERQMTFVVNEMNRRVATRKHKRAWVIVEPWVTYFGRLERDPDFRRIQVKAVRRALDRARAWWTRFGFKSERAFVFMFDLVSSHGAAWLDAKKFRGARTKLLDQMLSDKKGELGRPLTEREALDVIANMIADVSLERFRDDVRKRKLFFVRGTGRVHGHDFDLRRDFGVTDDPPDFGPATTAPVPVRSEPAREPPSSVPSFVLGIDTASVGGNVDPDWAKAKSEGKIEFAILRSNWGTARDKVFTRDWPALAAAGIVRGAYLFLRFPHPKYRQAPPSPAAQAKAFVATVGALAPSDLPPSLDVEFPGGAHATGMSARELLDGVRAAWQILRDHYGAAPIVYTSGRVWREDLKNLPAPDLAESPLWLARYPYKKGPARRNPTLLLNGKNDPPVPPPWGDSTNWWIHQYQGDAVHLPGIATGNVDMNRFATTASGARGDRVKWIQRRLGVAQSGVLDATTDAALRALQEKNRLAATGSVDPATFAFLCWSNP